LEYSEEAAVTPTLDLAKLALVTTQDEEEDDQGGAGTDASNDTDATLVEDGPVRAPERSSPSPIRSPRSPSSPTVLGKRNRGRPSDVNMEGITTVEDEKDYVVVSKSPSPLQDTERPKPERKGSSSKRKTTTEQEDVVMKDVQERKAPPLPPRKPATTSGSIMMFGLSSLSSG
jgi:ubiquitin carboxyl-terminal hydrolase 25